jgi:predicted nucleic acid-binding protein
MSGALSQPVVLDTTVLSNFASTGTVDRLVDITERPVTVSAVKTELEEGATQEHGFLDAALDCLGDGIAVLGTEALSDTETAEIRERLDRGEAESLRGAIEQEGTLATDDRAARTVATEQGVPVTGSVGLLVLGIQRGVVDADTANRWLDDWRTKRGYYAPVERIENILE